MRERPILFSAPMIRAILAGTKTQTRRVAKGVVAVHSRTGEALADIDSAGPRVACPYGQPGDRLWVRETYYAWGHWTKRYSQKKRREEWHFVDETVGAGLNYRYEANEKLPRRKRELHEVAWWKRPAIFMPRWASRITLEVTAVRVERLQDISEADAHAEGADCLTWSGIKGTAADLIDWPLKEVNNPYRNGYAVLWESINGPDSWDANPWVWVVEFRRLP